MATLSRWAIFLRAFMSALVAGGVYSADPAQAQDGQGAAASENAEDEAAEWAQTQRNGTPEAYFLYLRRHPRGQFVEEAMSALSSLGVLGPEVNLADSGFALY